jgi:uncharacterized protein (DUF1684 family)
LTRRCALALALLAGLLSACGPNADPKHRAEIVAWQTRRLSRLTAPDGWLSLSGLWWLAPGDNSVGTAADNRIVLPQGAGSAHAGVLKLAGTGVSAILTPEARVSIGDKPVTTADLASDGGGDPTILTAGSVSFFVIERQRRLGVRVKDSEAPTRKNFTRLEYYRIDPSWRFEAKFEPYNPPKKISVPTELGTPEVDISPGALVFERDGKTYRLDPVLEQGSADLFIIFGDKTNGSATYGAGRFLYAPMPTNGRTVVDFNKAYNPPCAFTPYATCPLPPAQNHLPFEVTAGEKKYR